MLYGSAWCLRFTISIALTISVYVRRHIEFLHHVLDRVCFNAVDCIKCFWFTVCLIDGTMYPW